MFCPKCGARIAVEKSVVVKLGKDTAPNSSPTEKTNSPEVSSERQEERTCPNCGKPIFDTWEKCPFCNAANPLYKKTPKKEVNSPSVKVEKEDTNLKCPHCGKIIYPWQPSCHNCGKPSPYFGNDVASNKSSPTSGNKAGSVQNSGSSPTQVPQSQNNETVLTIAKVNMVCRIISIAAFIIAIILDPLISSRMPKETFEDAANYNSLILFSYLFYGTFFICVVIRVVCGFILAYMHGEFAGMGIFLVVGLIITIIAGAISQAWGTCFVLFGFVTMIYTAFKLDGWI